MTSAELSGEMWAQPRCAVDSHGVDPAKCGDIVEIDEAGRSHGDGLLVPVVVGHVPHWRTGSVEGLMADGFAAEGPTKGMTVVPVDNSVCPESAHRTAATVLVWPGSVVVSSVVAL